MAQIIKAQNVNLSQTFTAHLNNCKPFTFAPAHKMMTLKGNHRISHIEINLLAVEAERAFVMVSAFYRDSNNNSQFISAPHGLWITTIMSDINPLADLQTEIEGLFIDQIEGVR